MPRRGTAVVKSADSAAGVVATFASSKRLPVLRLVAHRQLADGRVDGLG